MKSQFSTVDDAIAAVRRGETIIVVDAEDRENEGDFFCAAEKVTPEIVNFMISEGRGNSACPSCRTWPSGSSYRKCARPIRLRWERRTPSRSIIAAQRLALPPKRRATTIQKILDPTSKPGDFFRPGHLFPLVAKEGGVLRRAGHTEAAVDLARLADFAPAGVLCEILDEQGDRAGLGALFALAAKFDLQIISIAELIRYRRRARKVGLSDC